MFKHFIIHNYFDDPNKIIFRSVSKFLDTSMFYNNMTQNGKYRRAHIIST